jgi:hypothetical protein
MARPAGHEWQPLGLDADPVPGDPSRISDEIAHLSAVASEISGQVDALRKIGSDGTLVGKYADTLRSKSNEVAGDLEKVVGRYQKVSSALSGWLPDLEHAQAISLTALNEAAGPYKTVSTPAVLPSGSNLTDQQKQQVQAYHTSQNQAQQALNAARALLDKATTLRDNSGSYHAHLIHSAADDSMKDGFWDHFKNAWDDAWDAVKDWVKENAKWIGDICTALEIIGTILAVAAFIIAQFIPGLDILVDALVLGAFVATAGAATGRLLMAATGNGSWWDFALDAFACATFGLGRAAGGIIRVLADNTEVTAKGFVAGERGLAALCGTDPGAVAGLARATAEDLTGGAKLAVSLGGYGADGNNLARVLGVAGRYAGTVADWSGLAKGMAAVMGLGAGSTLVTGAGSLLFGGVEFDGSKGPIIDLHIPVLSTWYKRTFEVPTGGG